MHRRQPTLCATGLAVALTVLAALPLAAQDTTRTDTSQVRSERRIPVGKGSRAFTRVESPGTVDLIAMERARVDSAMAAERTRVDSIAAAFNTALREREEAFNRSLQSLNDTLATTRREVADVTVRANALSDTLTQVRTRFDRWRNRRLFGNGFYFGLGTGATFTNGQFHELGFDNGLDVVIPIGYNHPMLPIGIRADFGVQTWAGIPGPVGDNNDVRAYSAAINGILRIPLNQKRTNAVYGVVGGGVYSFRNITESSALSVALDTQDNAIGESEDVTKFGFTAGGGLSLGMPLGTALFVESRFTSVDAEVGSLRWVPLVFGITFH